MGVVHIQQQRTDQREQVEGLMHQPRRDERSDDGERPV